MGVEIKKKTFEGICPVCQSKFEAEVKCRPYRVLGIKNEGKIWYAVCPFCGYEYVTEVLNICYGCGVQATKGQWKLIGVDKDDRGYQEWFCEKCCNEEGGE